MVSLMELRQSDPNEDSGNLAGDSLLRSIMNEMGTKLIQWKLMVMKMDLIIYQI